jgi:hypothetical protein
VQDAVNSTGRIAPTVSSTDSRSMSGEYTADHPAPWCR